MYFEFLIKTSVFKNGQTVSLKIPELFLLSSVTKDT